MNRYTNLSFNSLNDLPQLTLPFNEIDSLLSSQQSKLDVFDASTNLTPKFIQQSEDDRNLAGQIMKYQQDVKSQLAEIAKTGNVNAYMEGLNQAQNQIKKLYQPGGAADVLQQRYIQDEAEKKRLLEFYKDKPDWANHAIKTRQYNKVGYNAGTGEYNPVNSFGNTPAYISAEKRNEWFNKNLDNIKNSILYDENGKERKGINRHQLDNISSVYDFWNVEGVPYERLIDIFESTFPEEFKKSIYHDEAVQKFYSGDDTPIDTNVYTKDKDGKVILNPNNPVAKELHGYAKAGERYNKAHHYQVNQDEVLKMQLQHELNKKEAKFKNELENPFIPPTTGYTETVSNPFFSDIDEVEFKDGKPIAKTQSKTIETTVPSMTSGTGFSSFGSEKRTISTGEKRVVNEKENELLDGIKERHKDLYGKDMTDAQLEKTYNALVQDRKSIKTMYNQYNDNKQKKNRTEVVLGDEKSLLNAGSRPMYVLSPTGAIEPKSVDQIVEMLGTDILGKGIEGEINPDNPFGTPTGDYATAVTKDGKQVAIVIGNRSIEEDSYMSTATQLAKAKYSLKPETIIVRDAQGRPTGAKLRSVPIIQTDENGEYQGVDAKIEMYDANQNLIGTKPLSEYIQEKKSTNPYSNK